MRMIRDNPDPIAVLVGVVVEAMAILDLPQHWGLSATQVMQLGGLVIIAAGTIRTWVRWRARRRVPHPG